MQRKKKRRLKKKIKLFLLGFTLIGIFVGFYIVTKEEPIEDKIQEMKITGINQDFLQWLNKTYPSDFELFYEEYEKEYNERLWHKCFKQSYLVLEDQYNNVDEATIKTGNTITVLGDTAFPDNYFGGQKYDERKQGINGLLSKNITDYLKQQSLVIANAEFAIGEGGKPTPNKYYTFIGSKKRAEIFLEMNVDLVTLANNHVHDFGENVFKQTLDIYKEIGIDTVGAGMNLDEASQAQYYIINGYKFSFINANRSEKNILTPGATLDNPGVVRCYDPNHLISMIEKESKKADFVIPILHWGAENSHEIQDVLLETSHQYIDAGADAIIGHHAHVLQGIEYYKGKPIFYNLGNFLFDDDVEGGIVEINVNDSGKLDYEFMPIMQIDVYTDFLYNQERIKIINMMNEWGINAFIDEEGNVIEK